MRGSKFFGALTFEPQFRVGRAAQRAGAMSTGVVQPDAIIAVGAFVNVVALGPGTAGSYIPRCPHGAPVESVCGINGGKMVVENALNHSRLHGRILQQFQRHGKEAF